MDVACGEKNYYYDLTGKLLALIHTIIITIRILEVFHYLACTLTSSNL